jgi:hypothetical protein
VAQAWTGTRSDCAVLDFLLLLRQGKRRVKKITSSLLKRQGKVERDTTISVVSPEEFGTIKKLITNVFIRHSTLPADKGRSQCEGLYKTISTLSCF